MKKILIALAIITLFVVACTEEYKVAEPTTPSAPAEQTPTPASTPSTTTAQQTPTTTSSNNQLLTDDLDQAKSDLDAVGQ